MLLYDDDDDEYEHYMIIGLSDTRTTPHTSLHCIAHSLQYLLLQIPQLSTLQQPQRMRQQALVCFGE